MNIFIDTTALVAILDADDAEHAAATRIWRKIINEGDMLVTHNYVIMEAACLIMKRLGIKAFRVFERDIAPMLHVIWISRDVHEAAMAACMVAERKSLSLVDCVSLEILRRTGLKTVFSIHREFEQQGFVSVDWN